MTKPRVLLAHSLLWPNVGRLSIAFRKAGFAVDALAPASHPIHKMHSPDRTYVYRPTSPAASLRRAIEISQPQLIIPCDDRIVGHLHRLHGSLSSIQNSAGPQAIATLIETSLGSPASFGLSPAAGSSAACRICPTFTSRKPIPSGICVNWSVDR